MNSELMKQEILQLKKEKNAVILGHYYIDGELQDIADFVGDSLQLAQQAAKTNADIIVFLGVYFMAETAKILSPYKKVLIPDLKAGCSLADSCEPNKLKELKEKYPDHIVVSYVNTTAEIKALTDIVVTSSNAVKIIESIPESQKIIFTPDRNLGNYLNMLTGRDMVVYDGACHVHEQFSLEKLIELKEKHPDAKVLAHPECELPVRMLADFIGSTSSILNFSKNKEFNSFIVATESGILHQMQKARPDAEFIPLPGNDSTCACNECNFMKLNTVEKLYNSLKNEEFEVNVDKEIADKARGSIVKMLELS
ncbi:MAG: quinolinate synthase NadA [Bacteroidales bacterium]|nr:quinolinate synthase NadA [Bacteroidales bacterium]